MRKIRRGLFFGAPPDGSGVSRKRRMERYLWSRSGMGHDAFRFVEPVARPDDFFAAGFFVVRFAAVVARGAGFPLPPPCRLRRSASMMSTTLPPFSSGSG